eukprot:UN01087
MALSRFFTRNHKKANHCIEGRSATSDESHKKIIVKKDLGKIKWRHMKPKRGYRNGIYPKWSRLRHKVYKSVSRNTFQNGFITSIDKLRISVSSTNIPPVKLTRSQSSSSILKLRPPNDHNH